MSDRVIEATANILKPLLTGVVMKQNIIRDCNEVLTAGVYYTALNTANRPNGLYGYGALVVLDGNMFISQIYIPHYLQGNYTMATRCWYKGEWKSWYAYGGTPVSAVAPATE